MRNSTLNILILAVALFAVSCGSKTDRPDPILTPDQVQKQKNLDNNTTTISPPPTATTNSGVDHYTCPDGHPGGAAAGSCSTCGKPLVHNQAFHSQPATTNTISPPTTATPTPPKSPEPPQNASGVWHYTCPNGHDGGGGAAAPCSVCGTVLAHNAAYHQ